MDSDAFCEDMIVALDDMALDASEPRLAELVIHRLEATSLRVETVASRYGEYKAT